MTFLDRFLRFLYDWIKTGISIVQSSYTIYNFTISTKFTEAIDSYRQRQNVARGV